MYMLGRAATCLIVAAWAVSKAHHFQLHWYKHSESYAAAQLLLDSEVCTRPHLRMSLREYDNCGVAEAFVRLSPLNRAVYSLAEEMHVCGENRCAILYMDITDRLPYIFVCVCMLLLLIFYKCTRDYRHNSAIQECALMRLPHHKKYQ